MLNDQKWVFVAAGPSTICFQRVLLVRPAATMMAAVDRSIPETRTPTENRPALVKLASNVACVPILIEISAAAFQPRPSR